MPKTDDGQGEFADVADKKEGNRNRANPRENRGRRGGDEDGEQRRGGEGRGRGGRGRGDGERRGRGDGGPKRRGGADGRDRRANAVDEDGNPVAVDGAEAGGFRRGYQGKPREGDHPYDRKSGTGRGRRDDRRQGGRDGWGDDKEKKPEAADGEEAKGEPTGEDDGNRRRNNRDRNAERRAERDAPEKEESEEEVGFTLDDYEAQKKTGNLKTAAGRQHEKINQKGIQTNDNEKIRTQMLATQITSADTHAITRGAGAELLGFGAAKEDEFEYRQRGPPRGGDRGGRGGRGGDRGARGGNRGGRRGGKPIFNANNEDDFPAL